MDIVTGQSYEATGFTAGRNARPLLRVHAGSWRITEKVYFPGRTMPAHAHEENYVTFVLAGAIEEVSGARRDVLRPGSWVTKPAGVEHANRVGRRGARVLEFVWTGGAHVRGLEYGWHHGGAEIVTFLRVFGAIRALREEAPAVVAGLCRGAPFDSPRPARGPEWIATVREGLCDRRGSAGSLAALAAEHGVHPTYLARAFRRRFGCSIGEHTRELRVARAARLISSRLSASLCDVALASGFADQSHMTRAFRAHTGMSPALFRRWIRADALAPAPAGPGAAQPRRRRV